MSEDERAQNTVKRAAMVVLISLGREAEKKTIEELKAEIQKALEENLARIPGVTLEKVIVLEEETSDVKRT